MQNHTAGTSLLFVVVAATMWAAGSAPAAAWDEAYAEGLRQGFALEPAAKGQDDADH